VSKKKKSKHAVTAYAEAVLAGDIVTGRLVKLACQRHIRDLDQGHKRGLHFAEEDADHAINFFPEFLRHTEGRFADQPFFLSPHQIFIVGSLYGWLKADGYRRFRHSYWEESKGGGKTPTVSGCAIYGLTMDGEDGAEIFCAAVTRDQAGIAFRDCKHMAEKSEFAGQLVIGENNIAYPATNSLSALYPRKRNPSTVSAFLCRSWMRCMNIVPQFIDKMVAGNKGGCSLQLA
jgi:phage terminase large subunit-like protein